MTDAVYNGVSVGTGAAAATSLELTTAWNVNAAYEHFWSPRWRTSLYGGYAQVSYGGTAPKHPLRLWHQWCCHQRLRRRLADLVGRFAHPVERHQGLLHGSGRDVLQAAKRDLLRSARHLVRSALSPSSAPVLATDPDNWSFRFRVHRDFYP